MIYLDLCLRNLIYYNKELIDRLFDSCVLLDVIETLIGCLLIGTNELPKAEVSIDTSIFICAYVGC